MSDEAAFLEALKANPADDTARLVYADWLDEHGEPQKAEYLRLVCSLVGLPANEILEAPAADELLALTPIIDPVWQEEAGARFELALLEFNPTDRYLLILALERLLRPTHWRVLESLVTAAPTPLRSPLTYGAAVHLHHDWLQEWNHFQIRPRVVVRSIPPPFFSACGLFDVVLKKLPWSVWPNWGACYKGPVSALLGLPPRDAANKIRNLPVVLFPRVPQQEVQPLLGRIRRAFNAHGQEFLPQDAIAVVAHATFVNSEQN
ncbi:MAG TPA: TIGR02996 domain-containing protein [Gemmata sp.]